MFVQYYESTIITSILSFLMLILSRIVLLFVDYIDSQRLEFDIEKNLEWTKDEVVRRESCSKGFPFLSSSSPFCPTLICYLDEGTLWEMWLSICKYISDKLGSSNESPKYQAGVRDSFLGISCCDNRNSTCNSAPKIRMPFERYDRSCHQAGYLSVRENSRTDGNFKLNSFNTNSGTIPPR